MYITMIKGVVVFNIFDHLVQFQDLNIVAISSIMIVNHRIEVAFLVAFWLRFVIGITSHITNWSGLNFSRQMLTSFLKVSKTSAGFLSNFKKLFVPSCRTTECIFGSLYFSTIAIFSFVVDPLYGRIALSLGIVLSVCRFAIILLPKICTIVWKID